MASKTSLSAVILASGAASRLGIECKSVPKCLLEFDKVPFLNHLIGWLLESGVCRIIVTTCMHRAGIKREIEKNWSKFDVRTINEEILVNTVASAKAGLECIESGEAIVLTADTIWEFSLTDMIKSHGKRKADASILLTQRDSVPNYGKIKVSANDQVVDICGTFCCNKEKEQKDLIGASTMGVYIVNVAKLLKSINISNDSRIEKEPLSRLLPNVWAYWCEGLFLDFGTPDKLEYLRKNQHLVVKHYGSF